jgi:hypothetical protein
VRAFTLLLLCACASSGAARKTEDLVSDIREFQEGLRWRNYDRAADHVVAAQRARFLDAHDDLDADLRIDDYEVMRVTLTAQHTEALVRVKYTWHRDSVGKVHETIVDQKWERQGKIWRIVGSEHRQGDALPPETLPVESEGAPLP